VRKSAEYPYCLRALSAGLLFFTVGLVCAGCPPKIVRVPVSSEDLIKSNEVSAEGDVAFNRKDYYPALIKYLEASRLNPNNEYLFNRLGITYSQLKLYDEAVHAFQRSIALNPKYPYCINNLGATFFARKEHNKAEKYFKKAIKMKGNEASFYMNLGVLYFEKKKRDKAIAEWRKGLAIDPNILTSSNAISLAVEGDKSSQKDKHYFMARLFAAAGNIDKSIENLEQAFINGFTDIEAIQKQTDFDPIRKDGRFVEFMKNAPLWIKPK
jgi:tetratricopeptide (TPR) repeat protein